MNTRFIILVVSLCVPHGVFGQWPTIEWQRAYGGSDFDVACGHITTPDGGYIVAGTTASTDGDLRGMPHPERRDQQYGDRDIWLFKLAPNHEIEWQKVIGGSSSDSAGFITRTNDGGCIISGNSYSTDGDFQTTPGSGEGIIIKVTADGTIEWTRRIYVNEVYCVRESADGFYFFSGMTYGGHALIGKLEQDGDIVWTTTYKSTDVQYYNMPLSLSLSDENQYITSGYAYGRMWIAAFNDSNQAVWEYLWPGAYFNGESPASSFMEPANDGGQIVMWSRYTEENRPEIVISKLNADGAMTAEWDFDEYNLSGNVIKQLPDNGYIFLAGASDNLIACRLTATGDVLWRGWVGGSAPDKTVPTITMETPGHYTFCSITYSNDRDITNHHGEADIWLFQLNEAGAGVSPLRPESALIVSPNPASSVLHIDLGANRMATSLSIETIEGKVVRTIDINSGQECEIDIGTLSSGSYMISAIAGERIVDRQKFIKY